MRLHWFWSTNPQKIRWALEELGLAYELNFIDLGDGAHKTEEYQAIHPRGKVPALEVDGGVLWESNAALVYLARREERLWPGDAAGDAEALSLLFLEAAAFQDLAGVYFWNRVVRPRYGADVDESKVAATTPKMNRLLDVLASRLGEKEYLLGDFTLVDCAFGPWLPVLDLEEHPSLLAWRSRLVSRPAWTACEFSY